MKKKIKSFSLSKEAISAITKKASENNRSESQVVDMTILKAIGICATSLKRTGHDIEVESQRGAT